MSKADEFLNQYRMLEEELTKKYNYDEKYGSPVVRFINDKEGRAFKERLNMCREIRNFLSHHSELDGEPVVEPSDSIIQSLREVTEYLRKPPLAISYATHFEDILKASPNQKVQTVMKKMQKLGFSHVPVLESGELVGVFSIGTIFGYAIRNGFECLRDDMILDDLRELLPPDKHDNEKFLFLPETATLFEVRSEFEKRTQRSRRLAVIFLTDNGSMSGRIEAMLTPWDVIND